jgi:addiction module HigA family antidote
LINK